MVIKSRIQLKHRVPFMSKATTCRILPKLIADATHYVNDNHSHHLLPNNFVLDRYILAELNFDNLK